VALAEEPLRAEAARWTGSRRYRAAAMGPKPADDSHQHRAGLDGQARSPTVTARSVDAALHGGSLAGQASHGRRRHPRVAAGVADEAVLTRAGAGRLGAMIAGLAGLRLAEESPAAWAPRWGRARGDRLSNGTR